MPNLLAHYGVQGPLSRGTLPAGDLKWILTGCLLPDIPWILQRAVKTLFPGAVNPYDLWMYVSVQASLLFCLALALGFAALTTRPRTVFAVLGLNAILHLVLDALQTKWAAGVHLLAPFNWTPWSVGLFWPESLVTAAITVAGLGFLAWVAWRGGTQPDVPLEIESSGQLLLVGLALSSYFLLPGVFMDRAEAAGSHYVDVLRDREARAGRYVELDRATYVQRPEGDVIRTFPGDEIYPRNVDLDRSASVSIQGRFVSPDTVAVTGLHQHRSGLRDLSSYVGIAVLVIVWWRAILQQFRKSVERGRRSAREA